MKKLHFKNIYTRYMAIFMAIIILTVTVLGIIITTLIENFSIDSRKKELSNVAVTFETFLGKISDSETTLEDKIRERESTLLSALSINFMTTPNCKVLATDKDGNIIMSAFKDEDTGEIQINYGENSTADIEEIKKTTIPQETMEEILKEKDISMRRNCNGFFSSNVILFASVIENENSDTLGTVIAYTLSSKKGDMMSAMMRSIIIAVVWISIVALVAIYGVSYSVMKPLREISVAVNEFSRGNFSVRIPVRGNDELADLATSFNNMASALQSKDEMQRSFLSSASHDLRTPMTTIAGFIDGILDGAIPPEKQEYYLTIIKNEIKRLSRLVTSLLDISRLQSGERKFEMKNFNICEMVRQTVISFETQIEIKELDVEFDFDDFDMYVKGDKDAINQVIYNLCHNAIKFSYEKGKYRVSVKDCDKKIKFSIYNEGIGISPEDQPYVFDRFYKGDKSRGLDKTGVGLGLFITKTIIEAHGEKISVQSEYGKNCTFSFTLPKGEKTND